MGSRARRDQVAHRINSAVELFKEGRSTSEVIQLLSDTHGISPRQARRYAEQAQGFGRQVKVPEAKQVFTVKLSISLVQRLKETARERKSTLSSLVEQAIKADLSRPRTGPQGGGPAR